MRAKLLTPLAGDQIQSTYAKNGKSTVKIAKIGDRVEDFNTSLNEVRTELKLLWEEWDQVQAQLVKLGIEVFGVDAFEDSEGLKIDRIRGFKTEMESLELEHKNKLEKIQEEAEELSRHALDNMETAERVSSCFCCRIITA